MINFTPIFKRVLKIEGGYSDHPSDRGDKTRYGITMQTARQNGYKGPMHELPLEFAATIYYKEYWQRPNYDTVFEYSPKIAEKLFEAGINLGVKRASVYLQRALNCLNNRQEYYPDIKVDSLLQDKTMSALESFLALRGEEGEEVMLKIITCLQGEFYVYLSERDHMQESFIYGWINQRINL